MHLGPADAAHYGAGHHELLHPWVTPGIVHDSLGLQKEPDLLGDLPQAPGYKLEVDHWNAHEYAPLKALKEKRPRNASGPTPRETSLWSETS